MALGVSDGFIHNGWRRHRYGVLLQEEKVVINGIDLAMQREIFGKQLILKLKGTFYFAKYR